MFVATFNPSEQKILVKLTPDFEPTDNVHVFCSIDCLNQQSHTLRGPYRLVRKIEGVDPIRCDHCEQNALKQAS